MLELIGSMLGLSIILLNIIFVLIYIYLKKVVYGYWKKCKIPYDEPTMIIGNMDTKWLLQKKTMGGAIQSSYEKFKSNPIHGIYMLMSPVLSVNDPDVIKDVLIKNFQNFCDRGTYHNEDVDPLTSNVFLLSGEKWKILRTKFSHIFTPAKLKNLFPILTEMANDVITVTDENLTSTDIFDIKDLIDRYTTDTIFRHSFGCEANSLRNPNNKFRYYGNLAIENRPVINSLGFFTPSVLNFLRLPFFNPKASKFFQTLFINILNQRKVSKENRNDFVDMLIKMMENTQEIEQINDENHLTVENKIKEKASEPININVALAHAFIFYIAGFETSSSTVTMCLHELSVQPELQEKLQMEIDEFLKSGQELTMENLTKLEYLDMVFNETTRKHPILPILNRICVNDYTLPNCNYRVPKGMRLMISISGLHYNPEYYPDPYKFDPTRFSKENNATRHPGTFLPFGLGPRYCIGKRLGILQSKIILFTLLANYSFSTCEKTQIPIQYSTKSIAYVPDGPVYLRIKKRKP